MKINWSVFSENVAKPFFCTATTTRTTISITIPCFLEYLNWANEIDN